MSSEKTKAIVIRVVEFSESSCVVTLFTRDFGKIGALAKGARRPKSPFESAIDLLAVCRIVFLHKSSDSLDLLTEAKLDRRFRAGSKDLARLYAGFYVAELLREMTDLGDPNPDLFDAADHGLLELENGEDVASVILRFELSALEQLGHLPALHECAACGGSVPDDRGYLFGMLSGGLLCRRCRTGQRQVIRVSCETMEQLREFLRSINRDEHLTELPASQRGEVRGIMNQYVCHLLGKRLRMHDFLASVLGRNGN